MVVVVVVVEVNNVVVGASLAVEAAAPLAIMFGGAIAVAEPTPAVLSALNFCAPVESSLTGCFEAIAFGKRHLFAINLADRQVMF